MNRGLLSALEELREIYDLIGDVYREKAYRGAIATIRRLPYEVTCERLPELGRGIGRGILDKIREFVCKGKITELGKLRRDKTVMAARELSGILGVGPATIRAWVAQKIRSLRDLRLAVAKGKVKLTHAQQLGLRYYADLNERIPRAEVAALGEAVEARLKALNPALSFEISGSYRRGAATSGDIDIIVTTPRYDSALLDRFAEQLETDPDFVDIVSQGEQRITYLQRSPMSGKVRQIDVLYVPPESYWAAVCYFTGSGAFNTYLRGAAKKRGLRLNQNGLYRIGPLGRLELIPVASEQAIFDAIGVKWIPPEQRDQF